MDVENIDALNPAELEALLERALDPRVPVEVFYAVLERIGAHEQSAEATPQAGADPAGQARPAPSQGSGSPTPGPSASASASTSAPSQASSSVYQQSNVNQQFATSPQSAHLSQGTGSGQGANGRRVAQHGPVSRGFAISVSDTEATTVMRAVTDADGPRSGPANAAGPADAAISPTAQTTLMPAVNAAELVDDHGDKRPGAR